MSHFNINSLGFYGIAIGSVVLLFKAVTAYGEANLKAPPPIAGRYLIDTQNLPGCNQSEALVLTILQSGVYLNGSLQPANRSADSGVKVEEKPALSGRWDKENLTLAGSVASTLCPEPVNAAAADSRQPVKIEGKMEGETLQGQITLDSLRESFEFFAKREAPVNVREQH